jgi:hypothetical protein
MKTSLLPTCFHQGDRTYYTDLSTICYGGVLSEGCLGVLRTQRVSAITPTGLLYTHRSTTTLPSLPRLPSERGAQAEARMTGYFVAMDPCEACSPSGKNISVWRLAKWLVNFAYQPRYLTGLTHQNPRISRQIKLVGFSSASRGHTRR